MVNFVTIMIALGLASLLLPFVTYGKVNVGHNERHRSWMRYPDGTITVQYRVAVIGGLVLIVAIIWLSRWLANLLFG